MNELNQRMTDAEVQEYATGEVIKIQSRKITQLEVEVYQAVKERDRLREAYIFRHFELFLVYGFLAFLLVAMVIFGVGQ